MPTPTETLFFPKNFSSFRGRLHHKPPFCRHNPHLHKPYTQQYAYPVIKATIQLYDKSSPVYRCLEGISTQGYPNPEA